MKYSIPQFILSSLLAVAALAYATLPQVARAEDRPVRVPHNAFNKVDREDLKRPLREEGEIRVIVGLQTPDEIAGRGAPIADAAKAAAVSARQERVLGRLAGHNLRNVRRLRQHHFIAMTVDPDALQALLADPDVTSVTEDRVLYPVLNDTPGITRADKAWAEGYRGAGQVIAILDSGVDKTHPFFLNKVVSEACYSHPTGSNTSYCPVVNAVQTTQSTAVGSGLPCRDYDLICWHGTHVAGIAAGRYGVMTSTTGGIAPDAGIIAIQVFQRTCSGTKCAIIATDSDVLLALDRVYALRNTYNIASVNMSLAGDLYSTNCDNAFPAFKTIIDSLRSVNIATVIAAGNDNNSGAITAPSCISSAISVGSTTKSNQVSTSFSNSASFLSLLAPGSSITSSLPLAYSSSGYGSATGTSMATPHVAGAWAVLKSAKPNATVSEILTALQTTGVPITDPRNGIVKPLIQIGNTDTQLGALGVVRGQNTPPSVTITSPSNGASFAAPANIFLNATASATRSTISRVEFFQGTTKIGEALTSPYSMNWTNVSQGSYILTARATDSVGGVAVSGPISISVSVGAPPPATFQIAGTASLGSTPLSGVSFTATGASCTVSDGAGHYSCTVPQGYTGSVTPNKIGYSFTPGSRSYSSVGANQVAQDYTAVVNTDTVWLDDALPVGAAPGSDAGDTWTWISSNPTPMFGALAHQSNIAAGEHQHYFYNATNTLAVAVGDMLFTYVYLDPANPPSEIMLQWNDGNWEHRAYWGADLIPWGAGGTVSRRSMGSLPAVGQWVRLEVPAALVGLEGRTLNGMAFTLYGGRASWDYAGKTGSATTTYTLGGTVSASGGGLSGVSFTATGASCTVSDGAGHYSCTVPQGYTGSVTPNKIGYSFTPGSRSYSSVGANQVAQDYTAVVNTDTVWLDDALPVGAAPGSDAGDTWTWISSNPTPMFGALAHQSNIAAGEHQHYFYNATNTLAVAVGDMLFTYVYLDPANPPSEIMLQWNDGNWEHRAYWGADLIPWGAGGTVSRRSMGSLPAVGQWVRLEVPAALVGLEGRTLNGMAFTLYGGRASWDYAGKTGNGPQ